jgi:excisionase family DNA binding protein
MVIDNEFGTSGGRRLHAEHLIDLNSCATMSIPQVAKVLGIHKSTAYELIKRDEFPVPVIPLGGTYRVTKVAVRRLLKEHEMRESSPESL